MRLSLEGAPPRADGSPSCLVLRFDDKDNSEAFVLGPHDRWDRVGVSTCGRVVVAPEDSEVRRMLDMYAGQVDRGNFAAQITAVVGAPYQVVQGALDAAINELL